MRSSSPTVRKISLYCLDNLPVTIGDLHNGLPSFLPSSVPSTRYGSNGYTDCLTAYENIRQIMHIIENVVHPLTDEHGSPLANFSEYDTSFFIILDQSINLSKLYLQHGSKREYLDKNALCIPYAQKIIFGQYTINGRRHSTAIQLEIAAHEFCHVLISKILNNPKGFVNTDESGALEESLCDIFAVLISGRINGTWNWEIGENMGTEPGKALRNFCDPENSSPPQPSHYDYYDENQNAHINCGIHNKAFYNIIDTGYFTVDFLIELLILTIIQISDNLIPSSGTIVAKFSDSRKAMQESAEILLRETGLEDANITIRVNAISKAFVDVGIELPT